MTVFFDKPRKRWRYSFMLDCRRYVSYCVEHETGTPARNVTEARRYETFVRAKIGAAKPAEPVLPDPGARRTRSPRRRRPQRPSSGQRREP